MGADLYMKLKNPKVWGFERSARAVADGYFRDAYTDCSILWKYELSWWDDIAELKDEHGDISVANAKAFLVMLIAREAVFEANIRDESNETQQYFREGAKLLKRFLRDAIELNSPIEASL